MKIKTIGHYAFAFFESKEDIIKFDLVSKPYFSGKIDDLTYETAAEIAQIHPNYRKYYEASMMPLFQGKGRLFTGTESPVMALISYKTKKELHMPYILIWKVIKDNPTSLFSISTTEGINELFWNEDDANKKIITYEREHSDVEFFVEEIFPS